MAIEFDGVNERIDYPNIAGLAETDLSVAARFNPSAELISNEYLINFEKDLGGEVGLILWLRWDDPNISIAVTHTGNNTSKFIYTSPVNLTPNTWNNIIVTCVNSLLSEDVHVYLDGVEQNVELAQDGAGSLFKLNGELIIGGREPENTRNLTGRLADVGVWSGIVLPSERASYNSGLPPALVRASDLQFNVRFLNGDTTDTVTSHAGTVAGTPVEFAHPTNVVAITQSAPPARHVIGISNDSPVSDDRSPRLATAMPMPVQGVTAENQALPVTEITVFDQYDSGNCDAARAVITGQGGSSPTITLYARPGVRVETSDPTTAFYTMACRLTGLNGKSPTIRLNIDQAEPHLVYGAGGWPVDWRCWFSYDNGNWQRMAYSTVVGSFQEVSHSAPFSQDTVYIATRPPYSYGMMKAHTESIATESLVSEPPSSTGNGFVYGQSAATTRDGDDLPVPELDLVSYRISDDLAGPLDGTPKRCCVLLGRQHASEDQGSWQLQAFVDFLLAGSATANALVRDWEFFVYPMINPSGVWGNAFRGTLQHGERDRDPNRDWPGGATAGRLQVVTATRQAIWQDTGNVINALLDFHGLLRDDDQLFRKSGAVANRFAGYVSSHHPITVIDSLTEGGLVESYFLGLGVRLAVTPEGDGVVESMSEYSTFGEALAKGLNDSFLAADFPAHGTTGHTKAPAVTNHMYATQLTARWFNSGILG